MQIESGFVRRKGQAAHNFSRTLPPQQSDLAAQTLKDPYLFDFLGLSGEVEERRLERALISRITDLLLELGVGFSPSSAARSSSPSAAKISTSTCSFIT